jgi:hypothetical protein
MAMTDPTKLATTPNTISVTGFFADPGFEFVTRSMIGYAPQGVMDIGQVFATIARIAVPYEGTSSPGFLFRPDASDAKRPTLVMTNGSEGSKSGLWAWGASSTLARGWNAFIYDGPGHQNMLFDEGYPFRHDWEAVISPVVNSFLERGDVDGSALFAYGCSQAGYWLTRALAFEHRFVAAVVDPGIMDVSAAWFANLPPNLVALFKSRNSEKFNEAMSQAAKNPKMGEVIAARGRPFAKPTA